MPSILSAVATHREGMVFSTVANGHHVLTDYPLPPAPGKDSGHAAGEGKGPRPLELLLASLCACTGGAMAVILKKQGQAFDRLDVRAEGLRKDTHPTVFEKIDMVVTVSGAGLSEAKLRQALAQSEAICPVWCMLKAGVPIQARLSLGAGAASLL